nr:unnamed protein product [Digitaria exilis]
MDAERPAPALTSDLHEEIFLRVTASPAPPTSLVPQPRESATQLCCAPVRSARNQFNSRRRGLNQAWSCMRAHLTAEPEEAAA